MIVFTLWNNAFTAVFVLLGIIGLIALWWISTMNRLRHAQLKVQEAESGIDVALTKRHDTLTKLLGTVKGYAKHEAETLESIVKWRGGVPPHATISDKEAFLGQLETVASGIGVVVEQYPVLKADAVFRELQDAVVNTEEHLQAARRFYNANVTHLNTLVVSFPASLVANGLHVEKRPYFEAEPGKKQDVEIQF